MYTVKEIFPTLQGEGAHSGRAAIFCRFSGCNLWNGRSEDRNNAICKFCDTDFVGVNGINGGKFENALTLVAVIEKLWKSMTPSEARKYVVFTGGEPLLQLDTNLIKLLHKSGFEVAIETSGTLPVPKGVDWVCVSPKIGSELIVKQADEIKFVVPQGDTASQFDTELLLKKFENMNFKNFFIQPKDDINKSTNTEFAIGLCQARPIWRLSIQTHKLLGIL